MVITAAALAGAGKAAAGIGSLASGIKGLFGNNAAASAREQYIYNLKLQKQAQQWNEYMYKNRYTFQVEDLLNAGINPLYGIGNANSPTSGVTSVSMPDKVGESKNKQDLIMNGIALAQDWSAKKAMIEKTKQETQTEIHNTQLRQFEAIGKQLENIYKQKEISWYDKKQIAELKKAQSEIVKNMANANESTANVGNIIANTGKTNAETQGTKAQSQLEEIKAKWYKEHPKLGGIATGSRELSSAVLDLIGAGTLANSMYGNKNKYNLAKKRMRSGTARKNK